jgi:hypothetical protein
MIDACFKFEKVFEALCNHEKLSVRLQDYRLITLEWKVLKSNKDFLECAFKCTNIASGKKYATLSMQPLIWELLEKMCTDTINGSTQTGFTTPAVKMAASAMLEKLLKYYDNAKSQLNRVALFLDPRSSNSTPDAQLLKEIVR